MGVGIALIVFGVVVVGGMFLAAVIYGGDILTERDVESDSVADERAEGFYVDATVPSATKEQTVTYIQRYLRDERELAERFAEAPSADSLRAVEHQAISKRLAN
jgi:hypothetical protein